MYPGRFEYEQAGTVDEALTLLAAGEGETQVLAGGQGLVPDMKVGEASPDAVVDIRGIEGLDSIERVDEGVRIGALATHDAVSKSDLVATHAPLLAETAAEVADYQIRNRGTVGGNVAEADPEADLPAAILAADATIQVRGPDASRSIPATEFFVGPRETVLADDELLTAVDVPAVGTGAYVKRTHPARGYAMIGVATALAVDDGVIEGARIATVGVTERPLRLIEAEAELAGEARDRVLAGDDNGPLSRAAERAAEAVGDDRLHGDAYASGEFRAAQLPAAVRRAVREALGGSST